MRYTKFRAYIKRLNEIREVDSLSYEDGKIDSVSVYGCGDNTCRTCIDFYDFDEIEIMQYTGLKDSNGVEIYEEDIGEDEHGRRYRVSFKCGTFLFGSYNAMEFLNAHQIFNVIGNIHENLELMER